MLENILRVYDESTHEDRAHGMGWYYYAHFYARKTANKYDVPITQVAGVLSALSPNNKWERNIIDAKHLIRDFKLGRDLKYTKVSTYGANKTKAIRILNGEPVEKIILGPKTWNFYNNILHPSSEDFVTIDFHALNIYLGSYETKPLSKKLYDKVSKTYIQAAREIDLLPNQLQAITWVTWRKMKS